MDEEFLLAINGDWDALLAALRDNRTLAHQTDANGMTLLHWVCLHQDIPTEVLIKIVFANPHAVNVPNEAGHLPIDLAVQAECEERILEVLRAADKSRQEQEPEPAPPVGASVRGMARGVGSGRPFSPPAQHGGGGAYGYDYQEEEEDMTFENPRYFANPTPPQPQPHQGINGSARQQPLHHPGHVLATQHHHHQPHHLVEEEDPYDDYGHSNGGTPHHHQQQLQQQQQLGFHGRQTPIEENDQPVQMHYGVARKPLYSIYSGQANPGELQSKSLSLGDDRLRGRNFDTMSVATEDYNAFRGETASDSQVLQHHQQQMHSQQQALTSSSKWEPKGGTVTKGTSFPPRWKQSRSCHVCASRFTLTHRRHHCRNCGFSVCGQHSTNRVPLPRFGLGEPQRVCDKCFLAGRHVFGLGGPLGSAGSVVLSTAGGGGALSVASGSERHYDPQPQHYGHDHHNYEPSPQPHQYGGHHHHYEPHAPYSAGGGPSRRDSFGSYRP